MDVKEVRAKSEIGKDRRALPKIVFHQVKGFKHYTKTPLITQRLTNITENLPHTFERNAYLETFLECTSNKI